MPPGKRPHEPPLDPLLPPIEPDDPAPGLGQLKLPPGRFERPERGRPTPPPQSVEPGRQLCERCQRSQ